MKKKLNSTPKNVSPKNATQKNKAKKTPSGKPKPPPAKPLPGHPISWQSKSHRLEINPPLAISRSIHLDDLSTSEEDEKRESQERYKKSIDKLLNDVSVNGQEYIKAKTSEQLNASRRMLADQEDEIQVYRDDLQATSRDCNTLRRSVELLNKEVEATQTEAAILENEKGTLEKKLVTIELEGKEASRELYELRDSCRKLKLDRRLTAADIETLTNQRELLLNKLEEFELKNRKLRKLLHQERRCTEAEQLAADRCEILLQKLTEAESRLQNQSVQLVNQDKQINALVSQVEADKHQAKTYNDLHKTMEMTRAHLQSQLRQKEGEGNRLETRMRTVEEENREIGSKSEHYQAMFSATRDKASKDKEALKKATKIQRERAQKQEDINMELKTQLQDILLDNENGKRSAHVINEENTRLVFEKDNLTDDYNMLTKYMAELGNVLQLASKYASAKPNQVAEKILSEVKKMIATTVEREELVKKEAEVSQLRNALTEYESLTNEYKSQVDRLHSENDNFQQRLENQEKEVQKQQQSNVLEVNELRSTLQNKIAELDPYPEQLKRTEIRLGDTQQRADSAEQRCNDHKILVSELTQKVELLSEKLEHMQEKFKNKTNECNLASDKLQTLELRLEEASLAHRELILSVTRKDEVILNVQGKFEEQTIDNERLVDQLEIALSNSKKDFEMQKEKTFAKERGAQARILDLEAQLSRSVQNTELLKRSKEEAERKFSSRLQDMRDRLEQANSTTRSMQNYVHFLKSTYANVFSDDVE